MRQKGIDLRRPPQRARHTRCRAGGRFARGRGDGRAGDRQDRAARRTRRSHVDACLEFIDWCSGARAVGGAGPKVTVSQAGAREIELPANLPAATIVATGKDASPKLTLIGPKGERITSPDDDRPLIAKPFFVMKDPRAKLTQFAIAKPSAGRWKVIVESGELVSLKSAEGLERPRVKAKVIRRHGRFTLATRVDEDAAVTFVERGRSAGGKLAAHGRGAKRTAFTPAPGAGETRTIVAVVEGRGEYEVARYRAPSVQRPGRVRGLKVTPRRVSWRDGGEHEVRITFKDGRTTIQRTAKRGLKLRNARTVKVRKLADALAGPFTTKRIR